LNSSGTFTEKLGGKDWKTRIPPSVIGGRGEDRYSLICMNCMWLLITENLVTVKAVY
jgi:hypothetical protein